MRQSIIKKLMKRTVLSLRAEKVAAKVVLVIKVRIHEYFRFTADLAHLVAIAILLLKIWKTRSCAGISGRSQILFLVVFVCRYLDIFTNFVSPYNTVMKVFFIGSSVATVYFMWGKFKATYDRNHDTCRMEFLVIPAFLLALVVNHDFSVLEVLWTFSIYLEAVAIMPQLFMLSKPEPQKPSLLITCLHLAPIVRCTSLTGSTATTLNLSSIQLLWWRASYKRCFLLTFFICM
uniref:ER lumen protein-retaining receptor n=1 Tax=Ditylenchus dipsaci TaxID=166011 RepID=A0A915E075_9BILA